MKTIVVSDVHISKEAPYSWFKKPNKDAFVSFLNNIANRNDVNRLVFLGDLFDLWLYPIDTMPDTIPQIINNYPDIAAAIQCCVKNIEDVFYIPGNHDMFVCQNDLAALGCESKTVQLIDAETYNQKYSSNQFYIEHGNLEDMFNAPDTSADTIGNYPFGYIITRLLASDKKQGTMNNDLISKIKTIMDHIPYIIWGPLLIPLLGSWLKDRAGLDNNTLIRFYEPELDKKYTVGDIQKYYRSLTDRWHNIYKDDLCNPVFAGLDPNGLDWYAKTFSTNVILGHTHHAKVSSNYYNTGCWCQPGTGIKEDSIPTYLEITDTTLNLLKFPYGNI